MPAALQRPRSLLPLQLMVLVLSLCHLTTISASLILAPTTAFPVYQNLSQLQNACTAQMPGSTPAAIYTPEMMDLVAATLLNESVSRAYVSGYMNKDQTWLWSIVTNGTLATILIEGSDWATGFPEPPLTTHTYVAYDSALKGLVNPSGHEDYPVVCTTAVDAEQIAHTAGKFPWWGILIIVVAAVVVIAAAVLVFCCCCRHKKAVAFDEVDQEDDYRIFRATSFTSRGSVQSSQADKAETRSIVSAPPSRVMDVEVTSANSDVGSDSL